MLADDDRPRAGRPLHARKHPHKVGLPVAVESGDPEDLAMMEPEVDLAAARPDLHHVGFHDDAAPLGVLGRGDGLGRALRIAGYEAEKIGFGDVALFEDADIAPVAQHGHAIGDARHLRDAVGHDQNAGARIAQFADFCEQPFGRIEVKGGGRFVEDEDFRLGEEGARDRDPCLEIERQLAGHHIEVEIEPGELGHELACGSYFLGAGQHARPEPVGSKIEVVEHGAFVGDKHFLKDGRNADRTGVMGGVRRVAENVDLPRVDRQHAGNHLCKRALAAAVAAEDRMDLAEPRAERGAVERARDVERLSDADERNAVRSEGRGGCALFGALARPPRDEGRVNHPRNPEMAGGGFRREQG